MITVSPRISVIIPTYNRREALLRLLRSLAQQTCPPSRYEVVVADDGSTDGTGDAIQLISWPYVLRYSWRPNAGVNAARNRGLDHAGGEIVLFLDDDMVADTRLIEQHLLAHQDHERAIIKGRVIMAADESSSLDTFARLALGRPDLDAGDGLVCAISYQQVGGGHFSIRKLDIVAVGNWDEDYISYGFQDLELMYRCWKSGSCPYYVPDAVTYHYDHAASLLQTCQRIRRASSTAPSYLFRRHPELDGQLPMLRDKGPIIWEGDPPAMIARKLLRQAISAPLPLRGMEGLARQLETRWPSPAVLKRLYRWIISAYIYRGYRDGLREGSGGVS